MKLSTCSRIAGGVGLGAYLFNLYLPLSAQQPLSAMIFFLVAGFVCFVGPSLRALDHDTTDVRVALWPIGLGVVYGLSYWFLQLTDHLAKENSLVLPAATILSVLFGFVCLGSIQIDRRQAQRSGDHQTSAADQDRGSQS